MHSLRHVNFRNTAAFKGGELQTLKSQFLLKENTSASYREFKTLPVSALTPIKMAAHLLDGMSRSSWVYYLHSVW